MAKGNKAIKVDLPSEVVDKLDAMAASFQTSREEILLTALTPFFYGVYRGKLDEALAQV